MKYVGKIIGFPAKLFINNRVYIPKEYLRLYGLSEKSDDLFLTTSNQQLFYRPAFLCRREAPCGNYCSIIGGLVTLPVSWVRKNRLKRGDTLFLLGTTEGILILAR